MWGGWRCPKLTGDCGVTIACDQRPASFDDDHDDYDDDDRGGDNGNGDVSVAIATNFLSYILHQLMSIKKSMAISLLKSIQFKVITIMMIIMYESIDTL